MSMQGRQFAIKVALPISWRLFPRRRAEVLQRFSVTEADSAWHFLDALSHVDQPAIRARLFNNALEEVHHAALFRQAAVEEALGPINVPIAERGTIYDPERGLQHFFAFVYVGEKDVYDQFDAYAGAMAGGTVKRIFTQLKEDEDGHMQYAETRLNAMDAQHGRVRGQVRAIRRRRMLQSWMRGLRRVSDLMLGLVLVSLYFLFGALGISASRRARQTLRNGGQSGAGQP